MLSTEVYLLKQIYMNCLHEPTNIVQ